MKWIGKALSAVFALALLSLLLYASYRYLLPHWPLILFACYLLVGLVLNGTGLVTFIRDLRRSERPNEFILRELRRTSRARHRLRTIRALCADVLAAVANLLHWPVNALAGLSQHFRASNPRDFLVRFQLAPMHAYLAVYPLIIAVLAVGLALSGVHGRGYGRLLLLTILFGVPIRHMHYAMNPDGLALRLRRVTSRPYATYLLLLCCDFLSVVTLSAWLLLQASPRDLTVDHFFNAASSLFRFRDILRSVQGEAPSAAELLVCAIGLVFYLTLVRSLIRFRDFRRRDEDYCWLASQYNQLGHFATAARHLKHISLRTADSTFAELVALAGANQLDAAFEKARLLLEQRGGSRDAEAVFDVFAAVLSTYALPEHVAVDLVSRLAAAGARDAKLMGMVSLLAADKPRMRASLAEVLTSEESAYPLTVALLALGLNEVSTARSKLATARPGSELEEVCRLLLLVQLTVSDPDTTPTQDRQAFELWCRQHLPPIHGYLAALSTDWERATACIQLVSVCHIASCLGSPRVEELRHALDTLRSRNGTDPTLDAIVRAIQSRLAAPAGEPA